MQLFSKSHVAIFQLSKIKPQKSQTVIVQLTYLGVTFTKEYSNSCLQLEPRIYLPVPVRIPYTQYFMLIPLFTRLLSRTLV